MRTVPRLLAAIAAASLLANGAPTFGRALQESPPRPTGVILGQVVDAGSGRPIAGVTVVLTGTVQPRTTPGPTGQPTVTPADAAAAQAANAPRRVIADGSGTFVFHSLHKGSYRLVTEAPGYLPGNYGQQRLGGPSRQISVDEGERRTGIVIRKWQYASLGGTVLDEHGEPAVGISIRAMRFAEGDRRTIGYYGATQTDDRGAYRFGRLTPGEYIVSVPQSVTSIPSATVDALMHGGGGNASELISRELELSGVPFSGSSGVRIGTQQIQAVGAARLLAPPSIGDGGRTFAYQTVFYPGAMSLQEAQTVALASGQDRSGIDMQLRPVQTVRVSGSLSGPDGAVPNMGLKLFPAGLESQLPMENFEVAATVSDLLGNFQFPSVPMGSYSLRVMRVPQNQPPPPPLPPMPVGGQASVQRPAPVAPGPTPTTLWAEQAVSVADTDVTGVSVVLRTGLRVSGRVAFHGGTPPPSPDALQRMSISISSADGRQPFVSTTARPNASGLFTSIGLPPGRYFLSAASTAAGWSYRSATLGARSLDDDPLELGGSDLSGVTITFSDRPSQITGTVRDPTSPKDLTATVFCFVADYAAAIERGSIGRRMRTAGVSGAGTFTMTNVVPGSYLIVAVDNESATGTRDRGFYDRLARVATRITIAEGEKKPVDLLVSRVR